MTKQEFLAMSLSYGLKFKTKTEGNIEQLSGVDTYNVANWTNPQYPNGTICLYSSIDYSSMWSTDEAELILRPLSDLTNPIEHKGEKFVPINRIKESQYHLFFRDDITSPLEGLQFSELRKLVKWHFDLFGGIENKEAINVNDLKTNPYK